MILRFHDVSGPLSRRKDLRHWKLQRSKGAGKAKLDEADKVDRALELGRRGNLGEGVLLICIYIYIYTLLTYIWPKLYNSQT